MALGGSKEVGFSRFGVRDVDLRGSGGSLSRGPLTQTLKP